MFYVMIIHLVIVRIIAVYKMILAIKEKKKGNTLNAIYELIWSLIMCVISL